MRWSRVRILSGPPLLSMYHMHRIKNSFFAKSMSYMTEIHSSSPESSDSTTSSNDASFFEGSFQIDDIGRIISSTPGTAEIFGYNLNEFIGTNFIRLVHRDNRSAVFEVFMSIKKKMYNDTDMRKVKGQRKDGESINLIANIVCFKDANDVEKYAISFTAMDVELDAEFLFNNLRGDMARLLEDIRALKNLGYCEGEISEAIEFVKDMIDTRIQSLKIEDSD